jgi:hypothetical protein
MRTFILSVVPHVILVLGLSYPSDNFVPFSPRPNG